MHITPILHFLKRSQESGGKLHPFLHPFGLLIVICPLSNTTRIPLNCADFDVRYAELDISNSGSNPVTSTIARFFKTKNRVFCYPQFVRNTPFSVDISVFLQVPCCQISRINKQKAGAKLITPVLVCVFRHPVYRF